MSKIKEMKNNRFPKATLAEWEEQAEKALKGKPVSKLYSDTYEGITRKPIYTVEDTEAVQQAPHGKTDWSVSQQLYPGPSLVEVNATLKKELAEGLQTIHFSTFPASDPLALFVTNKDDVNILFKDITLDNHDMQVYAGEDATTIFSALHESNIQSSKLKGVIGVDPIGELVITGMLIHPLEELYDLMKTNVKWKNTHASSLKTIYLQASPYHHGGANAVQELAAVMSSAVEYLQALTKRGLSIDEAANEMIFSFPIGSDFFMELAKLRAARMLWSNIVKAFGGSEDAQNMTIHATTSKFNKSNLDPYVNMLRTTTEAFSAAVGGADSLNIDSYQLGGDTFSRRIARNTHYILKEESFLSKVADPAAGSYYVENLTSKLAEEAWKLFQQIEEIGGMVKALEKNFLQDQIDAVKKKRLNDVASRKRVLIGTNMYANIKENLKEPELAKIIERSEVYPAVKVEAIKPVRLSEFFEDLRYQAKAAERRTGSTPSVTLINLGALATHKPRTDFASGFFQVGGLTPILSPSFENLNELSSWVEKEKIEGQLCICGSDDSYAELLNESLAILQAPNRKIMLAGLPDTTRQEELKTLGVSDFIHMRSNCYKQLSTIHQEMGLAEHEA